MHNQDKLIKYGILHGYNNTTIVKNYGDVRTFSVEIINDGFSVEVRIKNGEDVVTLSFEPKPQKSKYKLTKKEKMKEKKRWQNLTLKEKITEITFHTRVKIMRIAHSLTIGYGMKGAKRVVKKIYKFMKSNKRFLDLSKYDTIMIKW